MKKNNFGFKNIKKFYNSFNGKQVKNSKISKIVEKTNLKNIIENSDLDKQSKTYDKESSFNIGNEFFYSIRFPNPKNIKHLDYIHSFYNNIANIKDIKFENNIVRKFESNINHLSYLDYLIIAYKAEKGIIIKPDFFWFTFLSEFSSIINSDVEKFRKYFTTSSEKTNIKVNSRSFTLLPVDLVLEKVLEHIQDFKKEDIIPNFSTLDEKSEFAFAASFLEACSPYYTYSMAGCGFPKIKVLGSIEDYELFKTKLELFKTIIPEIDVEEYCNKVGKVVDKIIENFNNSEFWMNILWTEEAYLREDINGWYKEFFIKEERSQIYFPKHISKVKYTEIILNNKFILLSGIFRSSESNNYLIPEFDYIILKDEEEI